MHFRFSLKIKNGENFVQNDVERDILRIIDAYDDSKDLPENLNSFNCKFISSINLISYYWHLIFLVC